MTSSQRLYRTHIVEGATHLDLLLATYDGLAEDLRVAAAAADQGDIHGRCKASHHALLLLGYLESWIPLLQEKSLEQSLAHFYLYARSELLRIQAAPNSQSLLELSLKICEIRAAWQKKSASISFNPEQPAVGQEIARLTWSA